MHLSMLEPSRRHEGEGVWGGVEGRPASGGAGGLTQLRPSLALQRGPQVRALTQSQVV